MSTQVTNPVSTRQSDLLDEWQALSICFISFSSPDRQQFLNTKKKEQPTLSNLIKRYEGLAIDDVEEAKQQVFESILMITRPREC